nr:fimbrial protein [uncultured Enterobacter sp.]
MKKSLLVLALMASPGLVFAQTSNNTVRFTGEVADQTCSVDVNGSASQPVVLMPTVAASALKAANDVAGKTNFTINLTNCTAATEDTLISTMFAGTDVTAGGNMGNAGTADNVEVQLVGTDSEAVDLSNGMTEVPGITLAKGETSASQDLAVQYITEEGTATAGTVEASAQYAIHYP